MKKLIILCSTILLFSITVQARDQISVVGSSTVYPFSTVVAENFGRDTGTGYSNHGIVPKGRKKGS